MMEALERDLKKKAKKKKKSREAVESLPVLPSKETGVLDPVVQQDLEVRSHKKKKKAKLVNGGEYFPQLVPPTCEEVELPRSEKRKKPRKPKDTAEAKDEIPSLHNHSVDKEIGSKSERTPIKLKTTGHTQDGPVERPSQIETVKKQLNLLPSATPIINLPGNTIEAFKNIKSKKKPKNRVGVSEANKPAKPLKVVKGAPKTPKTPKTPQKGGLNDNFKQITLHESLLARGLVSAQKKSKKKGEQDGPGKTVESPRDSIASPTVPLSVESPGKKTTYKPSEEVKGGKKRKLKKDSGNPNLAKPKRESKKTAKGEKVSVNSKKNDYSSSKGKGKKEEKMDVVGKASNNQQFFGQTINISDNSSDSAELKIATNEEDTSELSSEYDSSDSDHIMKNIKSFNKKGASKTPVKKSDEPPPPKPKPKIYSSSEDEEEDDEDDDAGEEPVAKPDADDVFLDGWTKGDVQKLLERMRKELPKNDFMKATTRLGQMNWENIKFGSHSAEQCLEKWKDIEKKLRGYRILEELLSDAEHWLEQPWTDFRRGGKNKNKVQKHPEMPKKPLTTYMIYFLKKKDKIAKEFPELSLTDLSKVAAERFNKLPPNKKAKYNDMHLALKEEYTKEMAKFAQAHPTEMAKYGRPKKAGPMPGWKGVEKPVPAVKLYINDRMKKHANDPNYDELAASYKAKWKALSAKKKLPYIKFAHDQEAKYLEDLKAYQATHPNVEIKYKPVLSKEERNIMLKTQGKPDKPPSSAYLLFSKEMLMNPTIKGLAPKERMQEVAKLWKNVSESEKEVYKQRLSELQAEYKLEYGSYLASLSDEQRKEEEEIMRSKRKGKDTDESAPPVKRPRTASKKLSNTRTLEEILKNEPKPPPADIFELFAEDIKRQLPNKNFPIKEIRKSFDSLLDEPRAELQEKLNKMKQAFLIETKKFLKSLTPEELKLYSSKQIKSSQHVKDIKLSESEDDDDDEDEDGSEEEGDEEEEEVEIEKKNGERNRPAEKAKTVAKADSTNKKDESASEDDDDDDDDDEDKGENKSSSSSSSSGSSSDEEGSSSSSSSSSSSEDEEDAENDAAAF